MTIHALRTRNQTGVVAGGGVIHSLSTISRSDDEICIVTEKITAEKERKRTLRSTRDRKRRVVVVVAVFITDVQVL